MGHRRVHHRVHERRQFLRIAMVDLEERAVVHLPPTNFHRTCDVLGPLQPICWILILFLKTVSGCNVGHSVRFSPRGERGCQNSVLGFPCGLARCKKSVGNLRVWKTGCQKNVLCKPLAHFLTQFGHFLHFSGAFLTLF